MTDVTPSINKRERENNNNNHENNNADQDILKKPKLDNNNMDDDIKFISTNPDDELEDIVDDYKENTPVNNISTKGTTTDSQDNSKNPTVEGDANIQYQYVPKKPDNPIYVPKNIHSGKYELPVISKEDSLNARSYLKHYGSAAFLNDYLPDELNTLYIYQLVKLLGFQVKDKDILDALTKVVENPEQLFRNVTSKNNTTDTTSGNIPPTTDDTENATSISADEDQFNDPLERKYAVKLIKDLQKAMNKVLSSRIKLANFHTIDDLLTKLKTAKKILVLTGAGISTSLGIPDFRSSEGFYSKIKHLGLDDPQDVFNYDIFTEDPAVFYNIAHLILPPDGIYSPLHSFIKALQDHDKLLRNYTQNIDNLESFAGIKNEKLIQCHGSFATATCRSCNWQIPGEKIFKFIRNSELPLCPYCNPMRQKYFPTTSASVSATNARKSYPNDTVTTATINNFSGNNTTAAANHNHKSNDSDLISNNTGTLANNEFHHIPKSYGVLKPDITFFGEALPAKFHRYIKKDVFDCDLLICIGTSLKVAPVSEIVNMIPANTPQVLINRDAVKHAEFDLTLLGLCDDVAAMLAQRLHWDIPHELWEKKLMNEKFDVVELDRGVYKVSEHKEDKKESV
ncbi:related to NAD-dependent histone deacetylase SIR2 [Saccharomycodes ludwigii]|uniref:Related to NAD-dependent histone deacetylase SIR2 n=1 Tax=Saccharomycodes ludwigii TaxID=36035 RepID=A0A376B478_9ASCO|nr:hypothetical protein SCDLUD_005062 [Saccharomycodes ludwigii]KAH3898735.1 hypothetical protein SCDLUD_005062 [Saccharomycodes ludwigii]SSD59496.1 related to NAD-dependent histone deacetylase SIR2 [Saccharomycodes ludwigii]